MPLNQALGSQRQANLCEFKASQDYTCETLFQKGGKGGRVRTEKKKYWILTDCH